MILFEAGVVEVMKEPVPCPQLARHWVLAAPLTHLSEAIEVELTDEAGEVGGFEEQVGVGLQVGTIVDVLDRGEELGFEELLVDDEPFTAGVPADRAVPGAVDDAPQLGREVIGVDRGGKKELLHFMAHDGAHRRD